MATTRSIVIGGHKTSVSLEDAFWTALKAIASERHMNLSELVTSIDSDRRHTNLSSAIRLASLIRAVSAAQVRFTAVGTWALDKMLAQLRVSSGPAIFRSLRGRPRDSLRLFVLIDPSHLRELPG